LGPEEIILVDTSITTDGVKLIFTDRGLPFDQSRPINDTERHRSEVNVAKTGFGLKMIQVLADEITYRRDENRSNVLEIRKELIV
jgi:anti-sigma regulatory factor (Ser/Thr protein kinase)